MISRMKPENVNLVKFEGTEKGYYATFEITGMDKTQLNKLEKGIILWEDEIKQRRSKIAVKGNKAYLTDFFTKESFESEYCSLVGIGIEKKLPERVDGDLLSINVDLAMMEQSAEWAIRHTSMTPKEHSEICGAVMDKLKELKEGESVE